VIVPRLARVGVVLVAAAALARVFPSATTLQPVGGPTAAASNAIAPSGRLTQLPGIAGCISSDTPKGRCRPFPPLLHPDPLSDNLPDAVELAVSPNGRDVYLAFAATMGNVLVHFNRSPATGQLSWDGRDYWSKRLKGPTGLAVAPDGRNVYVSSYFGDAIVVFRRNADTGRLTRAACLSKTGSGGQCIKARAFARPTDVALSANRRTVYVTASKDDSVAVFARNLATGTLAQLPGKAGCLKDRRASRSGNCTRVQHIRNPVALVTSPQTSDVYVAAEGRAGDTGNVAILKTTQTGALRQPRGARGCLKTTTRSTSCARIRAGRHPSDVLVSADATNLYVGGEGGIGIFRPPTQLAGRAGCIGPPASVGRWSCEAGGIRTGALAIAPDGQHVYGQGAVRDSSVAETGVVVAYRRGADGGLTRLSGPGSCVGYPNPPSAPEYAQCDFVDGVRFVYSVLVSPNGKNVYVGFVGDGFGPGIAVFRRS
jgi:DNA-binding beta-propeller fold protein YncE